MSIYKQYRKTKILLVTAIVGFLLVLLSADGASAGYTFASKKKGNNKDGIELRIQSTAIYNGILQEHLTWKLKGLVPGVDNFFAFDDVKPGDFGKHNITFKVKRNSAYVCLDFLNLEDYENGMTEPEELVDFSPEGDLSKHLQLFAWIDKNGNGSFDVGERVVFGADVENTAFTLMDNKSYALFDTKIGQSCSVDSVNRVGIMWCVGELMVNTKTAEVVCNGEGVGNVIQTDSMTVDVRLRAVQAKHNEKFVCVKEEKPKPKPKPTETKPKQKLDSDCQNCTEDDGAEIVVDDKNKIKDFQDFYERDFRVDVDSEVFYRIDDNRLSVRESLAEIRQNVSSLLRVNR